MRTRKTKAPRDILRWLIKNWAVPAGCGLLFLFLLNCVFFAGYVPSASMEPAIHKNSCVFGIRAAGEPALGDVVVFRHDGMLLVKRIAALPGDRVTVWGETLIVPEDGYFLLGDNTDASVDSRHWNDPFVRREQIVAKLLLSPPRSPP